MADTFARFTPAALGVLTLAQEGAQRLNHRAIGPEHLLLGVLREGTSVAATTLSYLGVAPPKVLSVIVRRNPPGTAAILDTISLTSDTKAALERAAAEADRLHHQAIGPEHLLLGILQDSQGGVAQMLTELGLSPERVRQQLLDDLAAQ